MAPPRSSRSSRIPAGPSWDQVELAPIILIRSSEEALAERAIQRLKNLARQQDPATEFADIDAASYRAGELQMLASPSLFGEFKVLTVSNLEQMSDALLTDSLAYLEAPSPTTSLLLRHNGGQRGKRLLDALAKSPYPVVTIQAVKPKDKIGLVQADVRTARRRIQPEAAAALVDALGSDLRELLAATAQLLVDTNGDITLEAVNTYYAGRYEATGFQVADAAIAGNVAAAVTALRHAIATGTDPVMIVSALATKVRQLARVAASGGRDLSPQQLGMSPWQAQRARQELPGWSDDALAAAIVAVARADAEVKGASRDPVHAAERAVLSICNARRGRLRA